MSFALPRNFPNSVLRIASAMDFTVGLSVNHSVWLAIVYKAARSNSATVFFSSRVNCPNLTLTLVSAVWCFGWTFNAISKSCFFKPTAAVGSCGFQPWAHNMYHATSAPTQTWFHKDQRIWNKKIRTKGFSPKE